MRHLTKNQIFAYHSNLISEPESLEIGKHLLTCEVCRRELPLPSVDHFWSTLLKEKEIEVVSEQKQVTNFRSSVSSLISLWNSPSTLVLGSATLAILICFSLLIWQNVNSSKVNIAGMTNQESILQTELPIFDKTPTDSNSQKVNSNRSMPLSNPRQLKNVSVKQASSGNNVIKPKNRNKKEQTSETRGVSKNCHEDKSIELEFVSEKENFVFKWKKVPKAVKYHLYISDDEEILIDEFETEKDTTFILKKTLEPQKSYKWKIIVTLENGKSIIGASQKFTVKSFHTYQVKPEKRSNSDVRCPANH